MKKRLETLLRLSLGNRQQLALQMVGRVLLHAALVGAAAGLVGTLFVAGHELTQNLVLGRLAGYLPLRADGEEVVSAGHVMTFHPWLLLVIPAVGALIGG